ncbi:hypothetical protein ACGFNV_11145 [Streptomyces sp. NPDC048751]|uniref:hypothetical protein n=1 Tax=Streptomyces sp. NPDC048751 TaxID=3365591 RepID=UPI0037215932
MPENTAIDERAEAPETEPHQPTTPQPTAPASAPEWLAPGPDPDSHTTPEQDTGEDEKEQAADEEVGDGLAAVPLLTNAVNLSTVGVCSAASYAGPVLALGAAAVAAAGTATTAVVAARRRAATRAAGAGGAGRAGRLTGAGTSRARAVQGSGGLARGGRGLLGSRRTAGAGTGGGTGGGGRTGGGRGSTAGRRTARTGTGHTAAAHGSGGTSRQGAGLHNSSHRRGTSSRTGRGGGLLGGAATGHGSAGNARRGASGGGLLSGGRRGAGRHGGVRGSGDGLFSGRGTANTGSGNSAGGGQGRRAGAARSTVAAAQGRIARWSRALQDTAGRGLSRLGGWLRRGLGWLWDRTAGARRRGWARLRHLLRLSAAAFFALIAALAVMPASLFVGLVANIPAVLSKRFAFNHVGMAWPKRVFHKVFGRLAEASRRRLHSQLSDMAEPITGEERPHVGHVCDDPGTQRPVPESTPPMKGEHVSVFATSAEEVANAYAVYEPPAMASVAAEYKGLPDAIRHVNEAVMALAENSAEHYPMDPAMADGVNQVAKILEATAAYADEIEPTFRQVHDRDLMRLENPRTNEHWWNVGGIDGDGALWAKPSVLATAAEEIRSVYQQWSPEGQGESAAMVVGAEYEGIPTGLEHLAEAVTSLSTRSADTWPVDPCIAEMVADVVHGLRKAVSAAMELYPAFRRLHEPEIEHNENPRNGEEMWNVPKGGAASA